VRLVVDTNLIVSGIFFGGLPGELLRMIIQDRIIAVVSPVIFSEYERVIERFREESKGRLERLSLASLVPHLKFIEPVTHVAFCRDPDDDKFLACAVDGACSCIVSGDADLLDLQEYAGIRIMTAREFLAAWRLLQVGGGGKGTDFSTTRTR